MKLPFTCPNSSDSSSVSVRPAQLSATNAPRARGELRVDVARDDVLADAALAGDEDLGIPDRRTLRERSTSAIWELPKTTRVGEAGDPLEPIIECMVKRSLPSNCYTLRDV